MKISALFKGMNPNHITQGFTLKNHEANDIASYYGTPLVAPFNCKVVNVVSTTQIDNGWELERGYGIRIQSTEDPTLSMSIWHCQPFFPIEIGDNVFQGTVIAFMGNSGFVLSGGQVVPVDIRTVPPFKGTHAHVTIGHTVNEVYTPSDYSKLIDYLMPINYDLRTSIMATLNKITNFLKK